MIEKAWKKREEEGLNEGRDLNEKMFDTRRVKLDKWEDNLGGMKKEVDFDFDFRNEWRERREGEGFAFEN